MDLNQGQGQGMGLNIDPSTLPSLLCKCGSKYWKQVVQLKELSAVNPANTSGQSGVIPIPDLVCALCGRGVEDQDSANSEVEGEIEGND